MHILSLVHSLNLSSSRVLQTENQDLGEATKLAVAAKQILFEDKRWRIVREYDIELR